MTEEARLTRPRRGVVSLLLLVAACGGGDGGEVEAPAAGRIVAEGSVPEQAPDLSTLSEWAQTQLRERQLWFRELAAEPGIQAEQRAEALGELANLYYAHELLEAAERCYRQAAELSPVDPRWPYYLGQLYRRRSELPQSVESFRRALELAPDDVPTLVRLGEVLVDQGHHAEATDFLHAALRLEATTAAAHVSLGRIASAEGQSAAAAEHFRRALELQPEATSLRHPLAQALRLLGRSSEAKAVLGTAGGGAVTLSDPLMMRVYAVDKGLRRALDRGDRARQEGRWAEAGEAFRAAVAADPLFSLPRLELGRFLASRSDLEGAREQLELAMDLSQRRLSIVLELAGLEERLGRVQRAVELYREAVAAEPEATTARLLLARNLGRLGRWEAAAQEYQRAIDLEPARALPRVGKATALVQLGRCPAALAEVEAGLRRSPRDGTLGHALARLLAGCPEERARDGDQALGIAEALAAGMPSPGHAEAVAMALAELGRFDEALAWQERGLAQARAAGRDDLVEWLSPNLRRFHDRRASHTPWPADGLALFAPGPAETGERPSPSPQP